MPPAPDPAFDAAVDEFIRQVLGVPLAELTTEELMRLTELVEAVQDGAAVLLALGDQLAAVRWPAA